MGLPTPDRMHRRIVALRALLADLDDEYRWAYELAYGQSGNSIPESGGTRNPAQIRPTEQVAVALSLVRNRAEHAANRVQMMTRDVREMLKTMLPAGDLTNARPQLYPRTITTEERESLRRAKQRRTARGAGWGTG